MLLYIRYLLFFLLIVATPTMTDATKSVSWFLQAIVSPGAYRL